jgi:hypothetical protein
VSVYCGGEWCTCVFSLERCIAQLHTNSLGMPPIPTQPAFVLEQIFKLVCGCVLLSSKPKFEFHVYIVWPSLRQVYLSLLRG